MRLEAAQELARRLVDHMRAYCQRIEIAGSIRRGANEIKDVELVITPDFEDRTLEGVLFDFPNTVNLLHEFLETSELIRWIKPGTHDIIDWPIKPDGKYWRGLILRGPSLLGIKVAHVGIKLDLFLARPEKLGSHLYDPHWLSRLLPGAGDLRSR